MPIWELVFTDTGERKELVLQQTQFYLFKNLNVCRGRVVEPRKLKSSVVRSCNTTMAAERLGLLVSC